MPCSRVAIITYHFKEEDWVEASGRRYHVQAPAWTALCHPFLQGFGPKDDDTLIYDFVREAIRYYSTNNIRSECFNVHISMMVLEFHWMPNAVSYTIWKS